MVGVNRGRTGAGRTSSRSGECNSRTAPTVQSQRTTDRCTRSQSFRQSQINFTSNPEPLLQQETLPAQADSNPQSPTQVPQTNQDVSYSCGDDPLQQNSPEVGSSSNPKRAVRGRGPTRCLALARMPPGQKLQVELQDGRVVGQNSKEFTSQVCARMRQPNRIPLNVKQFKDIPQQKLDLFWNVVQDKFHIFHSTTPPVGSTQSTVASSSSDVDPSTSTSSSTSLPMSITDLPPANDVTKKKFFQWLSDRYRDRRSNLHTEHYKLYNTDEERMQHKPNDVSDDDWKYLIDYFGSSEYKAMSKRNSLNKEKQTKRKTTSSCSYPRKRRMMKEETGVEPDALTFFKATHIKKNGTPVDEQSSQSINKMSELTEQVTQGSISLQPHEIVHEVEGPPKKGRCPLFGRGAEPKKLYGPQNSAEERHRQELNERQKRYDNHVAMLTGRIEEMESRMEDRIAAKVAEMIQRMGLQMPLQPTSNEPQIEVQHDDEGDVGDDLS